MIGMQNFKSGAALAVVFGSSISGILHADILTLADDTRLTGSVRSINESGVVELGSVLSPEPVLLKSGGVTKVEFDATQSQTTPLRTRVELTNGDELPVTVESLDDKNLTVITADAGPLVIPRTALKSMQLSAHPREIIYSGPRNLAEWSRSGEQAKNWTFANQSLVANGPASVSKNFETPQQFVIKLTLKWQTMPSFQIYFADLLEQDEEPQDRYYLQFNSAGLEIKRESSQGKRFQTVISLNRTPDQFTSNEIKLEIRVDRKASRLHLLINGEAEGAGVDPVAAPPAGNGVRLVNSAPAGTTQEIRAIEVAEFDHAGTRHRSEDRGQAKTDSMISRDDDRWSGQLSGVKKTSGGILFAFVSDFQKEPLELAESDVSMIFFAQEENPTPPNRDQLLALRLRGGGLLKVTSCIFSEASVTAQHPLLGSLKIDRAGISSLQRIDSRLQSKSKMKPEANAEE